MKKHIEYAKSFQTSIRFETESLSRLLDILKISRLGKDAIHITGTNGKGSVSAFLEKAALAQGLKPGRFSSPELIEKRECIRIGGRNIENSLFNRLISDIGEAAEKNSLPLSPFEMLFAAALSAFQKEKCSPLIIEVGMGGKGDATNVIKDTKIEIITKISVDHIKYLGNSVGEIARKKVAIIKRNSTVVSAIQEKEAEEIIRRECEKKNAKLVIRPPFESLGSDDIYEIISFGGKAVTLGLGGVAQLENAALAAKAAKIYGLSESAVISGLSAAENPARFERISENLYFDGAHNPAGAAVLAESIKRYFGGSPVNLIMGIMADKDYKKMLSVLNGENTRFYFVEVENNPRSAKAEELLKAAEELKIEKALALSLRDALCAADRSIPTVVCGSLYLYKSFSELKNIYSEDCL